MTRLYLSLRSSQEIFGPVAACTTFKTEEEVLAAFAASAVYEEADEYTRIYELKLGQLVES